MEKKYQVFVSSTYTDLIEERKMLTQAILEAGCIPAGMELFPASSKKQWDVIKQVIDESDFYMVSIAGRYGSIGTDDDGNNYSYTEMEFNYALQTNKPIIALLIKDAGELPSRNTESSETGKAMLAAFRSKASSSRMVAYWQTPEELKHQALLALTGMKRDTDACGWIRACKPDLFDFETIYDLKIKDYEDRIGKLNEEVELAKQETSNIRREMQESKPHLLHENLVISALLDSIEISLITKADTCNALLSVLDKLESCENSNIKHLVGEKKRQIEERFPDVFGEYVSGKEQALVLFHDFEQSVGTTFGFKSESERISEYGMYYPLLSRLTRAYLATILSDVSPLCSVTECPIDTTFETMSLIEDLLKFEDDPNIARLLIEAHKQHSELCRSELRDYMSDEF